MTNAITRFVNDDSGATAIEYGLIAALISIAIIAATTQLGSNILDRVPEGRRQHREVIGLAASPATDHISGRKRRCGRMRRRFTARPHADRQRLGRCQSFGRCNHRRIAADDTAERSQQGSMFVGINSRIANALAGSRQNVDPINARRRKPEDVVQR